MSQNDCDNDNFASTQFLQIQMNQIFDHREALERYCIVLVCLVATTQVTISIQAIFTCYPFLLTNLPLLKKQTASSRLT